MKPWKEWTQTIWSEPDGSGSSTRIITTIIVSFVVGIGLAFGVSAYKHGITIDQFNSYLMSAGTFIVTTCGPLYAANKAADWLKDKNRDKDGGQ